MKTYTIDIHPNLRNVTFSVKNGRLFEDALRKGTYKQFTIKVNKKDIRRVIEFARINGDEKDLELMNWYAHCNGYAMDLCVMNSGGKVTINTWSEFDD